MLFMLVKDVICVGKMLFVLVKDVTYVNKESSKHMILLDVMLSLQGILFVS